MRQHDNRLCFHVQPVTVNSNRESLLSALCRGQHVAESGLILSMIALGGVAVYQLSDCSAPDMTGMLRCSRRWGQP